MASEPDPVDPLSTSIVKAAVEPLSEGGQKLLARVLGPAADEVGKGHRVKTAGSRRTVPVRGAALAVLQQLHDTRTTEGDGYVFLGATGTSSSGRRASGSPWATSRSDSRRSRSGLG